MVASGSHLRQALDLAGGTLYSPPPQRNCQAIPTMSKLVPVRADAPVLA
jgi:hypothetical protein